MKITAKGRYALATMIYLGQKQNGECVPAIEIANKLAISKIYLEQVFSLLKRSGLVTSVKGAHGGYRLEKKSQGITAYDILSATEAAVFEETQETVNEQAPEIDDAMHSLIFKPLDKAVKLSLESVHLSDLVEEADSLSNNVGYIYVI